MKSLNETPVRWMDRPAGGHGAEDRVANFLRETLHPAEFVETGAATLPPRRFPIESARAQTIKLGGGGGGSVRRGRRRVCHARDRSTLAAGCDNRNPPGTRSRSGGKAARARAAFRDGGAERTNRRRFASAGESFGVDGSGAQFDPRFAAHAKNTGGQECPSRGPG